MRANLWGKVETGHRATIGVMHWIWSRGVTGLLDKAVRNAKIRVMMDSAAARIVELLKSRPWALPARIRCFVNGIEISKMKIDAYGESGVFRWAPWIGGWLKEPETLFYFGATVGRWGTG